MAEQFFKPEDVISTYTSNEAVEDGILFDVDIIIKNPLREGKQFFLKYVTIGLLEKGYWNNPQNNKKTLNIPNLIDLVNQAFRIFQKMLEYDYFISGSIQLPSGKRQKIFIAQNETGRYTAMLPEEY